MKVWVAIERDCDYAKIVAVYPTQELAKEHDRLAGGECEEHEVSETLHPDANEETRTRLDREAAEYRASWLRQQQYYEQAEKVAEAARPSERMNLCHCETFTKPTWTAHGYCRFCGGFSPTTYRQTLGEERLQRKIDELDSYKRDRMRAICAESSDTRSLE